MPCTVNAMHQSGPVGKHKARLALKHSDLWYERYPRKFREATSQMPFDLRGAYSLLIDVYYEHGGPLPNDDKWIAFSLYIDVRKWKHIRKALFACSVLTLGSDNLIHNKFADMILSVRSARMKADDEMSASTHGSTDLGTGGSTGLGTGGGFFRKTKRIQWPSSYNNKGQLQEDRKKETTTLEAEPIVAQATLADAVLTPDIRARFYKVASTFGMKPDTIAFPPPKDESDALLRNVVNVGLAEADDVEMATAAFCDGLTAMQASDMDAKSKGHSGRYGSGGVPAAIKYLNKCLRDKLADVRLADATARAKAMTEEEVQKKIAEKRLNGVERKRAGAQTWEEAAAALK